RETAHMGSAFPQTQAELMAYDAIVLSNVPHTALTEEILGWVEKWVGNRGAGLLMAGGPRSFGAGGWDGPVAERMCPVGMLGAADGELAPTVVEPTGTDLHPVWRLFDDERATRAALRGLPESLGRTTWARVKPQAGTLLGGQKAAPGTAAPPLLAGGGYGRGPAAALATPLSASWAPRLTPPLGEGEGNRHFAKFLRNMGYRLAQP